MPCSVLSTGQFNPSLRAEAPKGSLSGCGGKEEDLRRVPCIFSAQETGIETTSVTFSTQVVN